MNQTIVMILFQVRAQSFLWGLSRYVFTWFLLRKTPGLVFHKMLGSGYNGEFGIRPSLLRQGLFCIFNSTLDADNFIGGSQMKSYRSRAVEFFSAKMLTISSRGSWSKQTLQQVSTQTHPQPVVALTRASIRWGAIFRFWRKQPASSVALANSTGCLLAAGVGEAPLVRQATFTIWENVAAMEAFAKSGAHLDAIQTAMKERHFSESMFARFLPLEMKGTYKGRRFE